MKTLFQLSLVTAVRQKSVFIVLLLLIVGPFVFQQMTNYVADPSVLAPARVQATWQLAWLAGSLWLAYQAANLGGEHVRNKLGEYFLSRGEGRSSQMLALTLSVGVFGVLIALISVLMSAFVVTAGVGEGEAYSHWVVLSVQHAVLMLLVVLPVAQLAIALASRFGALVGYTGSVFLYILGFYMVLAVEKLVIAKDTFYFDLLYVVLPHFYLADLTHRFIHQQGAMTNGEFFAVFEYLAGWGILISAVSYFIFTPKKK
ncbi:hypothetical protein ACFPK9_04820 [Rubritalea spongiae]|uniref:ABC transporter permease n=1 Tax=Rubritalea spongiae TaxID=430797 RepID=A0ABW5E6A9_9BACT